MIPASPTSNLGSNNSDAKEKNNKHLNEKYSGITALYDSFFQIVSLGDVASIYWNRSCFQNQRRQALVKPATEVFLHLPSSRTSVYYYTGLLIHDSVNSWFNKKENVQHSGTTAAKESASRMLEFLLKFFNDPVGKADLEDALTWLCEISAELCAKNSMRPSMVHLQHGEEKLAMFKSIEIVSKMISLMNSVASSLLLEDADTCMKKLFEATRHGLHFSWMWLHVASLLQGNIITHVLKSGAEQFESYVAEVTLRKSLQGSTPATLNIIQAEYEQKFHAISDIFVFLMRKRNPDLQDAVSTLIENSLEHDAGRNEHAGFAFFFKLVTFSIKTLQILVTCNSHLITPFNAVRAIRQVQKIEKSIILPKTTFAEFIKQVVEEVDPVTHGKIFEMIIEIVHNQSLIEGESKADFEYNSKLRQDCLLILDVMVNRIVRIAHATGPFKCPSQHPAITAYSTGVRLQFILNSIIQNGERPGSLVRHLHAIAIANGEWKAAEIALRFLMTINDAKSMSIFMSFLTTTAPFYPYLMSRMYRDFSALQAMIEMTLAPTIDKNRLNLSLLMNLKTLFDWENLEDDSFSYVNVYPGKYTGNVLKVLLSDNLILISQSNDIREKLNVFHALRNLIVSIGLSNEDTDRRFLITLSEWYRLTSLLSIALKSALLLVRQDFPEGALLYGRLRSTIFDFLFNSCFDGQLSQFSPLFIQLFTSNCFVDSRALFDESSVDSAEILIDETGLNKLLDMTQLEEGPSVIEGLKNLKMRDSALDMLHSGKLKRRRKSVETFSSREMRMMADDAKERVLVALDTLSHMCFSGSLELCLTNSKQLSLTFLHKLCKDSLTIDMRFDEWEIESEFIHRHVEVDNRVSHSIFCGGILRILSETKSFAYCIPVMKSMLAVIINETEKFPDRLSCSEELRAKFHNWMMLAHKGGILPARLVHLCDLEKYLTVHETNLILLEVWKMMMNRNLSVNSLDMYHEDLLRGQVDEGVPNENEAMGKVNLSLFRLLIQNHLPQSFHLFPKFFPTEHDFLKLNKVE